MTNQQGPLDGDRTHQLKLFGAKDWVFTPKNRLSTGLIVPSDVGAHR